MTDFKAKMHQIRFRLGLRLRPRWAAYSAPRGPLAGFGGRFAAGGRGWAGEKEGKREGPEGRKGGVVGIEREAPSYC